MIIHKTNFLPCREKRAYPLEEQTGYVSRKTNAFCPWNDTKYLYTLRLKIWGFICYGEWCSYLPLGFKRLIVDLTANKIRQLKKFALDMEAEHPLP
jgi:hypothetical protein